MYKFCIFGGTTEGRRLAELLSGQDCEVTVCVATDYGQTLLPESDHLTVSAKRLPVDEIVAMLEKERFDLVIDATHPYATSITHSIAAACEKTKTEHWRLLREASVPADGAIFVPSAEEAVYCLSRTQGNILLTTGSKELPIYAAMPNFAERVWARVLPLPASLDACRAAELPASHIFAMQGPFSREMNFALLRSMRAEWLVTKDGGVPGGFDDKLAAAKAANARVLVVGRPAEGNGLSLRQCIQALCERFGLTVRREVSIVGIGPGKIEAQTLEVRSALTNADCVIGARRMLDAARSSCSVQVDAIDPQKIADWLDTHIECRRCVVVMSGDTGFFSGTKKLLPLLEDYEIHILPGLSSLSYLCAKLKTDYEDVIPVSLHGREHDIAADVRRHKRIFALVGGEDGMTRLCKALVNGGLGDVRLGVGERLGYPDERIRCGTAEELSLQDFDKLSVALIENDTPDAIVTQGLPDTAFLRDEHVPMTKSEVRSVCLSKLQLTQKAVCWDIGAGSGSVSIEMALQAQDGIVCAIEKNEAALALLGTNRSHTGAENVKIVAGCAPQACEGLPVPTHVFIGGSSGNMREILQAVLNKNPDARIVATAVSLESIAELKTCMDAFSFAETEVVSLQVAKARKLGRYRLMTGQNPVYIFTMQHGSVIK